MRAKLTSRPATTSAWPNPVDTPKLNANGRLGKKRSGRAGTMIASGLTPAGPCPAPPSAPIPTFPLSHLLVRSPARPPPLPLAPTLRPTRKTRLASRTTRRRTSMARRRMATRPQAGVSTAHDHAISAWRSRCWGGHPAQTHTSRAGMMDPFPLSRRVHQRDHIISELGLGR